MWKILAVTMLGGLLACMISACGGSDGISDEFDAGADTDTDTDTDTDKNLESMWQCLICGEEGA